MIHTPTELHLDDMPLQQFQTDLGNTFVQLTAVVTLSFIQ
jgi:hypothetical protein